MEKLIPQYPNDYLLVNSSVKKKQKHEGTGAGTGTCGEAVARAGEQPPPLALMVPSGIMH